MENKEVNIKMIPLNPFIDTLIELYNRGVDYIDIVGVMDDKQDRLAITFTEEYMTAEGVENFKDIPKEEIINTKLSDEDLDQLI